MDMKGDQNVRKQFSTEEKLKIISECQESGVKTTCSKYGIYPGSYYYWKKQLLQNGEGGLEHGNRKKDRSLIKTLKKEVETLKLLLAESELKSRLKDDLLEKKYPELRK